VDGCNFPTPVGSAPLGASPDGVEDLTGSVFEWAWDAHWEDPPPTNSVSYAGPPLATGDPSLDQEHFRNGGAFFYPPSSGLLYNDSPDQFAAQAFYGDAGFRCVRTVSRP
jgi:formylglycine-generating enzyme required for sulfatase activity